MTGPITVSSSAGLPTFRPRTRATKRSTNSSWTFASTMMRFVLMQIWPWCRNLPKTAVSTARSRSASSRMTAGEFPPSSSATRLRIGALAACSMMLPADLRRPRERDHARHRMEHEPLADLAAPRRSPR